MAKRFVKIPLATKLRVLFGLAVLGIIAAALVVPWYFMELLAEQAVQRSAVELMRIRLNEWIIDHHDPANRSRDSDVESLYSSGEEVMGRRGPTFIRIAAQSTPDRPIDAPARLALRAFNRGTNRGMPMVVPSEDDRGRPIYRCLQAVRAERTCMACHGASAASPRRYEPGELVGMIDLTMPALGATGMMVWWIRGAFVVGGALAAMLAVIMFAIITQRLILRPIRQLRNIADKVADGDLSAQSTIKTGDELQRLGDSFNEMLAAIDDQHNKLRQANRALDLKLSELAESNVALFQANKVKNEFLANVSHELRTPLNSIIGFADLLADSPDERIRRYGQNISASARSLLNMINDILDLARIESGKSEVRLDKVAVADTCRTLVALVQPLADKKQIDLRLELSPDLPLIFTDAGKFQQILYNLLSNAVKFTPPGGRVVMSGTLQPAQGEPAGAQEVSVSVADTGPGISEADQQHIFEKFFQADKSLTKESSGTGLGLSIAKELTSLLGGRLAMKSTPGHGTTFTLFLPVAGPERQKSPQADKPAGAG